jgi:hypothetical protein
MFATASAASIGSGLCRAHVRAERLEAARNGVHLRPEPLLGKLIHDFLHLSVDGPPALMEEGISKGPDARPWPGGHSCLHLALGH